MNKGGHFLLRGAVQALLRMAFFVLMYLGLTQDQGLLQAGCMGGAACMLVFLLMPGRFLMGQCLRDTDGKSNRKMAYKTALQMGCTRLCRGLLYSLPVLFLIGWFFYSFYTARGTEFGQAIKRFSWFLFMSPEKAGVDMGVIGFFVPLVLLSLYAVLGWRQDMPMEYVQHEGGVSAAFHESKKVRHAGAKELWKASLVNAVLMLVAIAAMAGVLLAYVWPEFAGADGMFALLQRGLALVQEPLPDKWLAALAGVYFVIAFPLSMVRKKIIYCAVTKIQQGM